MSLGRAYIRLRRRNGIPVVLLTAVLAGNGLTPHPSQSHTDAAGQAEEAKQPGGDAAAAPAANPEGLEAAKRVIRELLGEGALELSTGPASAAERFHFRLLTRVNDPVTGEPSTFSVTVVRDGVRSAVVVRVGEGERGPVFAYATQGLIAIVDPDRPGGLLLFHERFGPGFRLEANEQGFKFDWGFSDRAREEPRRITFDAKSILGGLVEHALAGSYDEAAGVVKIRTKNTGFGLTGLRAAGEARTPLGFEELVILMPHPPDRRLRTAIRVKVGDRPQPDIDYFALTRGDVERAGLPVFGETEADFEPARMMRLTFPPADLLRNDAGRAAAEKLRDLIDPAAAVAEPAGPAANPAEVPKAPAPAK